ncbi:CUGBP Elav-like family member 3-B [Cricetulus griseus]|uniref:CUGBP Elav-like family member 3-B n=2 Tax=Cricetulus griseus TaxID=10029 RepID=G3I339_CRIGR|nr:CUGBP Elav-like family member 3-B [Cricetulus griseus]XP_027288747.1 CUGBP Elav-like family member 3-B [Cricetulus griseus]EGW11350.1 Heterogeneous nuclear ribonucleoprotein D-like [Cricetulus griseus]ERE65023.1 Nucleotide-binding, alpha-beta plait containing protein [Cricetulus griseus]
MNTAGLSVRKYSERDQFHAGFRIDATKNEQDASKMFIGGLSPELNKQALLKYLSHFGEVIDFIIKIDPNTGLSRGFGFVLFKDSSAVEKVLQVKDHKVDGKKVEFRRAKAVESQFPIKKVFVGGLNPRVSEEKIRAYFGTFGQIEAVVLPLCSNTQRRRAFGFIKYTEETPARKVLETRFHFIGSSRCEVKMALPKEYPGRQSKIKAKAMVSERKAIPAAGFESHWRGECSQGFQFMANSDAQEDNLDAQRTNPYTFRANSNITVTNANGFRDTPSELQANSNTLGTNSSAFMACQHVSRPITNTVGVSNYALGSNTNAVWAYQDVLGWASPNAFRTTQYTLEPYPNPFGVSQYALASYPNAFGISQCAMGATPNVFWTYQYPLGTYPYAFGLSQYASGTSPNTFVTSQYTLSANSNAFRPNYYAFVENPYDFWTRHYALAATPCAFRACPYDLWANPHTFEASQYAVGATQNGFGANGNFYGTIGSGRSTEGLNFSQVHGNFLNVCNTLPALQGSNGDYFFLYSYRAYDLGSVLNYNVQINQPSPLGNVYQGIYSAFEA